MKNTTIAAISTPLGAGGIGVVRISGPEAILVAKKIFFPYGKKNIEDLSGYNGCLGTVRDGDNALDEAILFIYKAPKSYTGENVAEISCHGGLWLVQRILRLCIDNGAVLAGPGEFTQRAFRNGKIDLLQAEAVMDLIQAQGDSAIKVAMANRTGRMTAEIEKLEQALLEQASHLSAWADFPDEDVEEVESSTLLSALTICREKINSILTTFDQGKILREGVTVAIVGKPNVGKSTLMNALSGQQRSIVTELPGTTRDVIGETARIGELIIQLQDTAGIRETNDLVEKIGVEKSKNALMSAGLILAIFDGSRELDKNDMELLDLLKDKRAIGVINKADLPGKIDLSLVSTWLKSTVHLSASEGTGLDQLEKTIKSRLEIDNFDPSQAIVANERQRVALRDAYQSILSAEQALADGVTLDAVNVDIDCALDSLLSLTGKKVSDRVEQEVFSKFCVGK